MENKKPSTEKKKVLIVEDDNLIATILKMFLADLGYQLVGIVSSSEQSIVKSHKLNPDIVLMDITIEGKYDGIEMAKLIFSQFRIPIIFVSGDTSKETIQRAVKAHSYGYVVKPIDKNVLEIAIELALSKFSEDSKLYEKIDFLDNLADNSVFPIITFKDDEIHFLNKAGCRLLQVKSIDDLPSLKLTSIFTQTELKFLNRNILQLDKARPYKIIPLKTRSLFADIVEHRATISSFTFSNKVYFRLDLLPKSD